MFSSCQKDDERHRDTVTLKAIIADTPNTSGNSKVYIDTVTENSVMTYYSAWHNGDKVNINGAEYELEVGSNRGNALAATISGVEAGPTNSFVAAYPSTSTVEEGDLSPTVSVADTQVYKLTSISSSGSAKRQEVLSPMVGYCPAGSDTIKFHNAAGIIKVTVSNTTGAAFKVHYITVTADGEYLAGSGAVSGLGTSVPVMAKPASGSKTITLDCCGEHPEIANNGSAIFYIVSAPFEGQTLTFNVMAEDDSKTKYTFTATTNRTLSLENNKLGSVTVSISSSTTHSAALFWGEGTKKCPYLITNESDFVLLRDVVDRINDYDGINNDDDYNNSSIYYLQTNDLDLTKAPYAYTDWGMNTNYAVGSPSYPFQANYNGGSFELALSISSAAKDYPIGVFGVIDAGSTIRNLNVLGSISCSTYATHVGGVVGIVAGNALILNCNSSVAITSLYESTGNYGVGGICGYINADGCTVTIQYCRNTSGLTVKTSKVGGIVGYHELGTLNIIDCCNGGAITQSKSSGSVYSGGIVGYVKSGTETVKLTRCENKGNITGYAYVGGLIGYVAKNTEVTSCRNTASVSSQSSTSYNFYIGGMFGNGEAAITFKGINSQLGNVKGRVYVGGIIGRSAGGITVSENCTVNVGNPDTVVSVEYFGCLEITYFSKSNGGTEKLDKSTATGGFVGWSNRFYIKGSVNIYGSVVETEGGTKYAFVGGLVGLMYYNDKSYNTDYRLDISSGGKVHNYARVSGSTFVGGFSGFCACSQMLGEQNNEGNINGSDKYVGGLIGYHMNKFLYIGGITSNKGVIYGTNGVGGIVGQTSSCHVTVINSSNKGDVSGTYNVGGIIGHANPSNAQLRTWLHYCTNQAQVTARSSTSSGEVGVGGILGRVSNTSAVHLYNCANLYKEDKSINAASGGGYVSVGGIVGTVYGKGSIFNCYNTGVIDGINAYAIGGICGRIYTTDTISNCYNQGAIIGSAKSLTTGSGTSGIVGEIRGSDILVNNCYNSCDLSSSSSEKKYGVIGTYNGSAKLFNCYGPSSLSNGGRNYSSNSGSITEYRCSTLEMEEGFPTGNLSGNVGVAAENNDSQPGTGSYGTLASALRQWRSTNTTSSRPNYWPFLDWKDVTLPIFQE